MYYDQNRIFNISICEIARNSDPLRVHSESQSNITKRSRHESDGGELQEGEYVTGLIFEILGETAAPIEPGEGTLDEPTAGENDEALGDVRALDDLDLKLRHEFGDTLFEDGSLVAAIGEDFAQEWIQAKQSGNQQDPAVAILSIGRVDDRMHQ